MPATKWIRFTDEVVALNKYDPEEDDWGFVWTKWLAGDTIVSSTWTIPAGLTVGTDAFDTQNTSIFLAGGTPGVTYRIMNQIVTAAGRSPVGLIDLTVVDATP